MTNVEPPANDAPHGLPHRRVLVVEVRLLLDEDVEVVLLGLLVPLPRRAVEARLPVRRRSALARLLVDDGVPPDVPVALGAVARGAGLLEPAAMFLK